ncbi:hypothetical protein GOP47_0014886 [Adiantum capillus-veneris]|uniref:Uncharacterized protein n=1 Tax=Adiantum capillus-veneris TaxID=13818 RepID=A0A9D4UMC0_ADICA|nr:hypothetical protein GOP47_0014886 [Adiantum capillus-veneris]
MDAIVARKHKWSFEWHAETMLSQSSIHAINFPFPITRREDPPWSTITWSESLILAHFFKSSTPRLSWALRALMVIVWPLSIEAIISPYVCLSKAKYLVDAKANVSKHPL